MWDQFVGLIVRTTFFLKRWQICIYWIGSQQERSKKSYLGQKLFRQKVIAAPIILYGSNLNFEFWIASFKQINNYTFYYFSTTAYLSPLQKRMCKPIFMSNTTPLYFFKAVLSFELIWVLTVSPTNWSHKTWICQNLWYQRSQSYRAQISKRLLL